MSDYGQDLIKRGVKPIEGTWEFDGQENDLDVEALSYTDWKLVQKYAALSARVDSLEEEDIDESEVENIEETAESLDDFSWEDEDEEVDFIETLIDNCLVKPDINPRKDPLPIVVAIVEGMVEAWEKSPRVAEAEDEMPVDKGNG